MATIGRIVVYGGFAAMGVFAVVMIFVIARMAIAISDLPPCAFGCC